MRRVDVGVVGECVDSDAGVLRARHGIVHGPGRVIDGGEAILTTNAREDPRFGGQESIIAFNLRSILCVPLMVKTNIIGVIYTDNRIRTGIFSESERDLLTAFANQAAVAIENARLFSSLKRTLEEVTELKNLMDDVFESIVSGVITADVQDQITLCNRAAASILGFTSAEIVSAMPHLSARYIKTLPEVTGYLLENLQPGDVVLVLSAGAFLLSGRQVPRTGGFILARGERAEMEDVIHAAARLRSVCPTDPLP